MRRDLGRVNRTDAPLQLDAQVSDGGIGERETLVRCRGQLVETLPRRADRVGCRRAIAVQELLRPREQLLRLAHRRDVVGQCGIREVAPVATQLRVPFAERADTRVA